VPGFLSVGNYNTTLSSDSLETGTGSSNSLCSATQSLIFGVLQRDLQRISAHCALVRGRRLPLRYLVEHAGRFVDALTRSVPPILRVMDRLAYSAERLRSPTSSR
jgi:hypothetical protein